MPTVRSLITDALSEIGAIGVGEVPSAADAQLSLRYFQRQIDAWAADRLTLSVQRDVPIVWPAATSYQTIGPGGAIDTQRPQWINTMTYAVPASSPAVEVVMAPMDPDSFAAKSIKTLPSGLPREFFYQTMLNTALGSLYLWPQPTGPMLLHLYAPQAVDVPATLDDLMTGPPGYQDAFVYQLALRLCTPFGKNVQSIPLLPQLAQNAYAVLKRPNVEPGLLGVDAALTMETGGGYNVYSDTQSSRR